MNMAPRVYRQPIFSHLDSIFTVIMFLLCIPVAFLRPSVAVEGNSWAPFPPSQGLATATIRILLPLVRGTRRWFQCVDSRQVQQGDGLLWDPCHTSPLRSVLDGCDFATKREACAFCRNPVGNTEGEGSARVDYLSDTDRHNHRLVS